MASPRHAVALLGCAHPHTDDYVGDVGRSDDFEVSHVYDRSASRLAALVGRTGAAPFTPEAIPDGLAGILVLSQTCCHGEDISHALRARCPIFVEKPLALDARAAAVAIEAAGVAFHTGFFLRTLAPLRTLAAQLARGALGPIGVAKVRLSHDGFRRGWVDADDWIASPAMAGTGAFGDLAIHCVDLLHWLELGPLGDGRLRSASVLAGPAIEDYGLATFETPSGIASVEAGWADTQMTRLEIELLGAHGSCWTEGAHLLMRVDGMSCPTDLGALTLDAGAGLRPWLHGIRTGGWQDCVRPGEAADAWEIIARL